jgi:acyl-CoA thioesterase FadM
MPRVKLEEQSTYTFNHTVTVRVTDLNYGAHLANSALVEMLHEARARLFHHLGCSEVDLGDSRTGIIMADLVINFKAEGFLFETLRIDSHIAEISRHSFRIFQRVTKEKELVALAETGIVTFDYQVRSPAALPEAFRLALQTYLERREQEI